MRRARANGFTLIELLVVVAIILILVGAMVALIAAFLGPINRTECASNIRQIGTLLIAASTTTGKYPAAGETPADWDTAVLGRIEKPGILVCPAAAEGAEHNPAEQPWATCSYAYFGNLSPTVECAHCTGGERLWRLVWSGVDYTGGHRDGARNTDNSAFSKANGYDLADNVVFDPSKVDAGEPADPTIPDHQDLGYFGPAREPAGRALRAVPRNVGASPARPLLMDIVVLTQQPAAAGSWKTAHRDVTDADKAASRFFSNHCNTSARTKKDWGINIYYTNGTVGWKTWDDLRLQVLAPDIAGDDCHYFH